MKPMRSASATARVILGHRRFRRAAGAGVGVARGGCLRGGAGAVEGRAAGGRREGVVGGAAALGAATKTLR
jgi:hypothetical protein